MSARDAMTLVVGVLALMAVAIIALPRPGRASRRWQGQVTTGLACGLVAALVSSAPYVDLVPDRLETATWELVTVTIGLAVFVVFEVVRRVRHPSSSRRSPGASRSSTSRTHSGP